MKYKTFFMTSAILCTGVTLGQKIPQDQPEILDEVVVIDSKLGIKRENSGKVIVQITSSDLERSKGQTLPQVINRISGIEIGGSRGNEGQNLGYYIRGGRNRQVVVLLDGIQVNDPSSIANDFDLRLLALSKIESIEIIKGASSTLYGSGAGTAVISIRTKEAVEENLGVSLQSSIGTNQSQSAQDYRIAEFENSLDLSGRLGDFNYQGGFGHRYSDNLSAVSGLEDEPFEEDPFTKYNFFGRIGYKVHEDLNLHFFGNYDEFISSFDNYDFTDGDNELHSEQARIGSKLKYDYESGSLEFSSAINYLKREVISDFPNKFDGRSFIFDIFNKYEILDSFHSVLGVNGNFSRFNSHEVPFGGTEFEKTTTAELANFKIVDPYLNLVYLSDFGLNLNSGIRMNVHSNYGKHWVYNINPSFTYKYKDNYFKVMTSHSTAYITPSLYQLYYEPYGNTNLEPEENKTLEGGLEFKTGSFRASTVYFSRREKHFIDFVLVDPGNFAYGFENTKEEFTANGVEVELRFDITSFIGLSGNYTFTEAAEHFSFRIPKHKINSEIHYSMNGRTQTMLKYQFNGERTDNFFNETAMASENVVLERFGLLDFFVSHQVNDQISVFGSISNITNEDYRELYSFTTRGRNVRLGFSLNL